MRARADGFPADCVSSGAVSEKGRITMLTISRIGNAQNASKYFEGLTQKDRIVDPATGVVRYFHESGEPPGAWHGSESLGIESGSLVRAGALEKILNGVHPETGASLVQSQAGREHRPGWDLTFSTPKSVSAVWAVADPELRQQIEDAHEHAVREAKKYLDQNAGFTRRGKGGEELEQVSLIGIEYQHATSRAEDPHLHSHLLIVNVAKRSDGSLGTIDSRPLYQHRMAAGSLYQAELAARLHVLGFTIEKRAGGTFEIAGVPADLKKQWSSRHEQMVNNGATGQSKEAEAAFQKDRPDKPHVNRPKLFQKWAEQALVHGFDPVQARSLMNGPQHQSPDVADHGIDWTAIRAKLTESKSTFHAQDLTKLLAQNLYGKHNANEVRALTQSALSQPDSGIVRLGTDERGAGIFTTAEHLERERHMLQMMWRLVESETHAARGNAVEMAVQKERDGFRLSDEQAQAVRTLAGGSAISTLRGAAGAGKTTSMIALREAYEASGYRMVGATISNQAARVLQSESGIRSTSISKLLFELDKPDGSIRLDQKSVLVVDESGMVDTPQMARLVEHVNNANAKLILVGDEKQLQSIGAGGGFQAARQMTKSIGSDAELTETRRQKVAWQKEAAERFALGQAREALSLYETEGRLTTGDGIEDTSKKLIDDWTKDRLEDKGTQLIIASSHAQGAVLNRLAQEALKMHGLIGQVELAKDLVTEKHGKQSLYQGDEIRFHENSRGPKGIGVINGDTGMVQGITPDGKIRVRLTDGRTVAFDPTAYRNWTLGYASTVYKSQGSTVDRAYYLLSSTDRREMSYVAASRHRQDLRIYADRTLYESRKDRDKLIEEISRGLSKSDEKELALAQVHRHDDGGHSR